VIGYLVSNTALQNGRLGRLSDLAGEGEEQRRHSFVLVGWDRQDLRRLVMAIWHENQRHRLSLFNPKLDPPKTVDGSGHPETSTDPHVDAVFGEGYCRFGCLHDCSVAMRVMVQWCRPRLALQHGVGAIRRPSGLRGQAFSLLTRSPR
jgi:hypothetical protein